MTTPKKQDLLDLLSAGVRSDAAQTAAITRNSDEVFRMGRCMDDVLSAQHRANDLKAEELRLLAVKLEAKIAMWKIILSSSGLTLIITLIAKALAAHFGIAL